MRGGFRDAEHLDVGDGAVDVDIARGSEHFGLLLAAGRVKE